MAEMLSAVVAEAFQIAEACEVRLIDEATVNLKIKSTSTTDEQKEGDGVEAKPDSEHASEMTPTPPAQIASWTYGRCLVQRCS